MKMIHESVKIYGNTRIGKNAVILENVILGYPTARVLREVAEKKIGLEEYRFNGVKIGDNAVIRSNTVIYCDVKIGNNLRTGHNVMIREETTIGDNVLIGTNAVIEGKTRIGNNVSIQSNVYIPTNTVVEDFVFLGPNVVLTNDKYPIREEYPLKGPHKAWRNRGRQRRRSSRRGDRRGRLCRRRRRRHEGHVPAWKLAIGVPAKILDLPRRLKTLNRIQ